MEILGIGFPELIFVLIIAILVLGPRDMQKAGQTLGKWLRAILTSDAWMASQQFSREVKKQLTTLVREANQDLHEIRDGMNIAETPRKTAGTRRSPPPVRPADEPGPTASPAGPGTPGAEPTDADPEKT